MSETEHVLLRQLRRALSKLDLQKVIYSIAPGMSHTSLMAPGYSRLAIPLYGNHAMEILNAEGQIITTDLLPGNVLFSGANAWHRPLHCHAKSFITFVFHPDYTRLLWGLQRDPNNRPRGPKYWHHFLTPRDSITEAMLRQMEALSSLPGEQETAIHQTLALMYHLSKALPRQQPLSTRSDLTMQAVKAYVDDHYQEPITREDIAREVGIHPNHVSRLFQRHTGKSMTDYLHSVRLKQASQLLQTTMLPVKTIAYATGFSSSGYFCRLFKRHQGLTPLQFRARNYSQ